jgi:G:T/U-mismatch repair DNA glycosylase
LNTPEKHPFVWFVAEGATTLIIGTYPPVTRRWGFPFFYPNLQNLFWKILASVAGVELSDHTHLLVEERKSILYKLNAGVTDMGKVIRRIADNSKDESLELIKPMQILSILRLRPTIRKIIITSSSGKSSALAWFRHYLKRQDIACIVPAGNKPVSFRLELNKRQIDVYVLYSSSRRASNRISFEKLVDMYRNVFNA